MLGAKGVKRKFAEGEVWVDRENAAKCMKVTL